MRDYRDLGGGGAMLALYPRYVIIIGATDASRCIRGARECKHVSTGAGVCCENVQSGTERCKQIQLYASRRKYMAKCAHR